MLYRKQQPTLKNSMRSQKFHILMKSNRNFYIFRKILVFKWRNILNIFYKFFSWCRKSAAAEEISIPIFKNSRHVESPKIYIKG